MEDYSRAEALSERVLHLISGSCMFSSFSPRPFLHHIHTKPCTSFVAGNHSVYVVVAVFKNSRGEIRLSPRYTGPCVFLPPHGVHAEVNATS